MTCWGLETGKVSPRPMGGHGEKTIIFWDIEVEHGTIQSYISEFVCL